MTIAVQTNSVAYNGDGLTLTFNFNFYCTDPSWLVVKVGNVITAPSSIILNTDQSANPGGAVVFGVAPPVGTGNVFIQRHVPLTQSFNYTYLDAFPATSHMGALDKLTAEVQDLSILVNTELLLPPFTLANALQYLQVNTLGTALQWNDPIPKPYVPGWVLGASSPTTLTWVAGGGGGGGGGINVIGPVTTGQADGAAITGLTGNVLQLSEADATHPGVMSAAKQTVGGLKLFKDGAAVQVFDIRNYGGIPNDDTKDVSDAFYAAAQAAGTVQTYPPFFDAYAGSRVIYFPAGRWYTSKPLVVPTLCTVTGEDQLTTIIQAGVGTAATPTKVQAFAGPVFYLTGIVKDLGTYPYKLTYSTPLVGVTGQSLVLDPDMATLWLHDCWPFTFMVEQTISTTQLAIEGWVQIDDSPSLNYIAPIFGSRGQSNLWLAPKYPVDIAFGVYAISTDGVNMKLRAYLTTQNWPVGTFLVQHTGTQQFIDSAPITLHTPIHFELDYNGSSFDFYVNGVNQGHLSQTGTICKAPWEGVAIGGAGEEGEVIPQSTYPMLAPHGKLDSIRVSRVARHVGLGGFTPPTTKYTWDSNTAWLWNFDQGETPAQGSQYLPFVLAQSIGVTSPGAGPDLPGLDTANPIPHYIRLNGATGTEFTSIKNLQVFCSSNTSGIIHDACSSARHEKVAVVLSTHFAFKNRDGGSFYCSAEDCSTWWGSSFGFHWFGDLNRPTTQSNGICISLGGGTLRDSFCQPSWTSYIPHLFDLSSILATVATEGISNDAEVWNFTRQLAPVVIRAAGGGAVTFRNSIHDASNSDGPPFLVIGSPRQIVSEADTITADPVRSPAKYAVNYYNDANKMMVIAPVSGTNSLPPSVPASFVSVLDAGGQTNLQGLTSTEVPAKNLCGTFTAQYGFTYGDINFTAPELDLNYDIVIQYKSHVGAAPAAGSTTIDPDKGIQNKTLRGCRVFLAADPANDCILTFTWFLVRTKGDAALSIYKPTIPSTVANPYAGALPNWAVGVTAVPVGRKCFAYNAFATAETLVSNGTVPLGPNWWEGALSILGASQFEASIGAQGIDFDSYVADGKLVGLLNPGTHNFVWGIFGSSNGHFYIDGARTIVPAIYTSPIQQATIYIGERSDTSHPLTLATLRHLKMDVDVNRVITIEQDSGPGLQDQACFFGDDFIQGYGSTSVNGGFATQKAEASYGTTYYWMASQIYNGWLTSRINFPGLISNIWEPWGQNQPFVAFCALAGTNDLLNPVGTPPTTGVTAAVAWTEMLKVLEGTAATAVWHPPTNQSTTPWVGGGGRAWAEFNVNSAGTASCVIDGINFPCTFTVDNLTTATNLANAINAHVTVGALVHATPVNLGPNTGNQFNVFIAALAPGTAGNGITCTTDGVSGASWWTGFPAAGATFGGQDGFLVIEGVSFLANYHTSLATTLNDMVTAVNTHPAISLLCTAVSTGTDVKFTASVVGNTGNALTINATGALNGASVNTPFLGPPNFVGGTNGVLTNSVPVIVMCTLPPFGDSTYYTGAKETERNNFNTLLKNWVTAHAGAGAVLADLDVTLRNPGDHTKLDPAYVSGDHYINDAGHTAALAVVGPLLP